MAHMEEKAGPSWIQSSSSDDEKQRENSKRMKYRSKRLSQRKKMIPSKVSQRKRSLLRQQAVCFDEEIIEPCRSPQLSERAGDSDHVEEYEELNQRDTDEAYIKEFNTTNSRGSPENKQSRYTTLRNNVNQETTFTHGRKTVLYGQTPGAIRRSQLADMAESSGMTIEDFANFVLESSTKEKLQCLRFYHTTKIQQLSPFFDELDRCADQIETSHSDVIENEENIKRINNNSPGRNSNQQTRKIHKSKSTNPRTRNNLQTNNKSNNIRTMKSSREKDTMGNHVTVIPDTESELSDTDYIPPSPESSFSHSQLQRPLNRISSGNKRYQNDQLSENNSGQCPTRESSSTSTTSSLFEPLIGKDDAHATNSESNIKTSDYNQVLDDLFNSLPSDCKQRNKLAERNCKSSVRKKVSQNINNITHTNGNYNTVLDTILFGEPMSSSTQLRSGIKESSNGSEGEDQITSNESNSQDIVEEKGSNKKVLNSLPSSFELAQSPWSVLEHLFDN